MSKTATYALIETVTLGSAVSTVSFNVSGLGFTDLILVMQAKNSAGDSNVRMRFNSDTTSNYSSTFLDGNGTSPFTSRVSNATFAYLDNYGQIQNNFNSNIIVHIMDYANATTSKTIISRANNAAKGVDVIVSLWRKTPEAITNITLSQGGNNFDTGSTFNLYGIQAGNA